MTENRPTMSFKETRNTLIENIELGLHTCVWGQTGIGKTAMAYDLEKVTGRKLKTIQLASTEASDASGLPDMNPKTGTVTFYKSEMINFKKGEKYILLLDEFNRAPMDVQQAWLGVFNPVQHIGVHPIGADVIVIACMNDATLQDSVFVQDVDDAMKTRAMNIILKPDIKDYVEYFSKVYGKNLFIDFLKSPHRQEVIHNDLQNIYESPSQIICTPRNMEMGCRWVASKSMEAINNHLHRLQGIVGKEVISAFKAFLIDYVRLDGKELLKAKPCKLFNDLISEIDSERSDCLTSAINQAISLLADSTEIQIKNFFLNVFKLEENHSELIAVTTQAIKKVTSQKVRKVMAQTDLLPFFIRYNKKNKNHSNSQ